MDVFFIKNYMVQVLFMLIPSALASLYGLVFIFPKTRSVYFRFPVLAMLSNTVAMISYALLNNTGYTYESGFSVGLFGQYCTEAFVVAANIGAVSAFINSNVLEKNNYKKLAWIGPAVVFLSVFFTMLYWGIGPYAELWQGVLFDTAVFYVVGVILTSWAVYYSLKTVLTPDVKDGFISCMRPYNIVMCIFLVLFNYAGAVRYFEYDSVIKCILVIIFFIILSGSILILLPLLERGRRKWIAL